MQKISPSGISSPCVKVCIIEDAVGLCIGCGRTREEITLWKTLSEEDRCALMETFPARLARMPQQSTDFVICTPKDPQEGF